MTFRLFILITTLLLSACSLKSQTNETVYIQPAIEQPIQVNGELKQRIILLGDAGLSSIIPLQASLQKAVEHAEKSPEKTAVIMLGDNIYPSGFPNKKPEQQTLNAEQIKHISFLEAQLQVAKQSGAEMFVIPGNHDWYATQVDSQAQYIENYARENKLSAKFVPYQTNSTPVPQMIYREGISLVFLDTMWLIKAEQSDFQMAMQHLKALLAKSYQEFPENIILLNAHHPIETMGPHGGYYSGFGYQLYATIVTFFNNNQQDIDSPKYQRLINHINSLLAPYKKTIYAAGHDHSLQVFKQQSNVKTHYNLVSGAANTAKLSGVSNNGNSQFATSQEGFIEMDVLDKGVLLKVFNIHQTTPIYQQWLWKK